MSIWRDRDKPMYKFGTYSDYEKPPQSKDWYRKEAEELLKVETESLAWDGKSSFIDALIWRLHIDHMATIEAAGDQWSHVYVCLPDKTLMFSSMYSFEAALCKALMVLEGKYPMPEADKPREKMTDE